MVNTGTHFEEDQPYETGFARYYDSYLSHYVKQFESARRRAKMLTRIYLLFGTLPFNIILYWAVYELIFGNLDWLGDFTESHDFLAIFLWLGVIVVFYMTLFFLTPLSIGLGYRPVLQYEEQVADVIYPIILHFIDGTKEYQLKPDKHANDEYMLLKDHVDIGIVPDLDYCQSCRFEHRLIGEHQGIGFESCNVKAKFQSNLKNVLPTDYPIYFEGMMVVLSLQEPIIDNVVNMRHKLLLGDEQYGIHPRLYKPLPSCSMVGTSLDEYYVYSDHPQRGENLCNQNMKTLLSQLQAEFEAKTVSITITPQKVVCFFEGDVNKVFNFKLSDGNEDFIDDAKFLMHRAYLCRFLIEKINEIDIKG